MSSILKIAIVADDLTGAADAGVQFCPYLGPIYMAGSEQILLDSVDVQSKGITVFTNTRSCGPAQAAEIVSRAARVIRQLDPGMIYKKIDSCLRGNLGPELDAMLSSLHATASFVSPALPEQGRTTVNDCHRINGIPVHETEIGRDPLCPVNESRLSLLLATQSQMSIGHIHLNYLEAGLEPLFQQVNKLLLEGCRHIVFDAQETKHLDAITTLALTRFKDILLVGSAGLAQSLARSMTPKPAPEKITARPQLKKWLFVCGSASRILAEQADMLARSTDWPRIMVDPNLLTADITSAQHRLLLTRLKTSWRAGSLIISIDQNLGSKADENPERIVEGLADVVFSLLSITTPDGLFLSGGDTAEKVLQKTDGSAILLREEILPGVMRGEIAHGPLKGLAVFTKPGAFGQPDTVIKLLQSLKSTSPQKS